MIGDAKNVILQFSGGKDSTALIYKARPWLDRITVVFAETGATFPHVVDHIERTCKALGARLVTLRPPMDVQSYTALNGLPADLVPVETSAAMARFMNPPPAQILQPYTQCCGAMLWEPMLKYCHENAVDLVLRGSKRSDRRVGVGPEHTGDGITYRSPLWEWTDDAVFDYLRAENVVLPDHYRSINDSIDCWLCTAHLGHHGEQKMDYIKMAYPELWPIVADRVHRMHAMLAHELRQIMPALAAANK